MEREGSAVSLISLGIATAMTTVLFFGNFTLAYLVQALRGEAVPLARFALVLLLTLLGAAALLWGWRRWRRTRPQQHAAPNGAPAIPDPQHPAPAPPPAPPPAQPEVPTGDPGSRKHRLLAQGRQRLLHLAESPTGFTLDRALGDTGLSADELFYLIDELVGAGRIEAIATGRDFRYHLRETTEQPADHDPAVERKRNKR